MNTLLVTCTIIINLSLYNSSQRLVLSLLIINKYYTTNSIKSFVFIQFIILNFCRLLLFSLCITNCHIDTAINHRILKRFNGLADNKYRFVISKVN